MVTVSTSQPGLKVSRLTQFRLKMALRRRANALHDAEQRYQEEVSAILGQDRASVQALRRGEAANVLFGTKPAEVLVNPYRHALQATADRPRPKWMFDPAALLRGGH